MRAPHQGDQYSAIFLTYASDFREQMGHGMCSQMRTDDYPDPMSRTHALLDMIVGFDADRSMRRTLDALARACRGACDALDVPPQIMENLRQCVEEGATAHQNPGAIDHIALTPEAAAYLMSHGARPGNGWVVQLLRWMERSLHSNNQLPTTVSPQTPNEWMQHAIRRSITLEPGLDWLFCYKSEISGNREILVDRLSLRDREVARHLRQARVALGMPLVPLHAEPHLYTYLLADVLDQYPKHRLLWQDLGTDLVARHLLEKGADPSRILSSNSSVSRDDPFLVRALFKDPGLVHTLLERGAIVSPRVFDDLGRALVDRQRRLSPDEETCTALKALVKRMPLELDPDTRMVEGANSRTLASVIEQMLPGVLEGHRALRHAHLIDRSTPHLDTPGTLRRL